jgi:hypothetical protein
MVTASAWPARGGVGSRIAVGWKILTSPTSPIPID